jgi:hypothetical protein
LFSKRSKKGVARGNEKKIGPGNFWNKRKGDSVIKDKRREGNDGKREIGKY